MCLAGLGQTDIFVEFMQCWEIVCCKGHASGCWVAFYHGDTAVCHARGPVHGVRRSVFRLVGLVSLRVGKNALLLFALHLRIHVVPVSSVLPVQNFITKLISFDAAGDEAGSCAATSQPVLMRSAVSIGSLGSSNSARSSWATVPMSSATRARRNWQRAMQVRTETGP